MKTIFITSLHGLISRNILHTPILSTLSKTHRVIILVPDFKKPFFEREFGAPHIIIEGISPFLSRHDRIFGLLAFLMLPTQTGAIKKKSEIFKSKKGLIRFLLKLGVASLQWLGRLPVWIRLFRFVDFWTTPRSALGTLLVAYKPSLIVATDITHPLDVRLMKEGKRAGVRVLGMVRSWDNVTAKEILRFLPDQILVHNDILKRELIRYDAVPEGRITIVGIPHYDRYVRKHEVPRELSIERLGLTPRKPVILYAPFGNRYLQYLETDRDIINALSSLDATILVRMPPADSVTLDEASLPSNVKIMRTGTRSWKDQYGLDSAKVNEISRSDDESLIETLSIADLVVASPSTIAIDALMFDLNVIFVGFDGNTKLPYDQSVRRYFDYNHFRPILKSNAFPLATSKADLIRLVEEALRHPDARREERRILFEQECFSGDGRSSERVIEAIQKMV